MSARGIVGTRLAVALFVALLVTATAPHVAGGTATATLADVGQIEPDTVLMDVSLHPDGDAAWAIRYLVRLDDENASAAFDSLQADVRENRSAYAARFEERIEGTVRVAENATGRDMAVRNVSVRTTRQEIPQEYGVLIYEFEWTNFAGVDGSTIRAGDAIGGLFLDESTSLTVRWPAGYTLESADPSPDETGDRSATWRGPHDFATDQPQLAVSEVDDPAAGGGDGGDGGESSDGLPTVLLAVVALVLLGAAVAGVWWFGRRSGPPDATPSSTETEPPGELLSNEERVLRLLDEHGGRMKQQQVVEELGWTDAKTSQVVGALREDGRIEAFRLGRENVLDLPDEDGSRDDRRDAVSTGVWELDETDSPWHREHQFNEGNPHRANTVASLAWLTRSGIG